MFKFASKKEAADFAYLLLMLHTCKHNKNLEDKSDVNWFIKSTKELCPETMKMTTDTTPLELMFKQISEKEFFSPLQWDIKIQEGYDPDSMIIDVEIWVAQSTNTDPSEDEFIECLNYTSDKFLFHYHNKLDAPARLVNIVEKHFRKDIIQRLKNIALGDTTDLDW